MINDDQNANTSIASTLRALMTRLEALELAVQRKAPKAPASVTAERAVLMDRLDRLTIKRHAVLTATLGGLSYKEIATLMACDVATVKLHLKGVLTILGIKDRAFLLAVHGDMLIHLTEQEYQRRYGLRKTWWIQPPPGLMAVLRATKPAKNQYTMQKE